MSALQSPAELIANARSGRPEALGELYALHASAVMAVAFRLTGSAADAEDVLHDLFLCLPEALRGYQERGSFGGWLRRVAVRLALTRMRSGRRRREVPMEALAYDPPGARPEQLEARMSLDRALAALPEPLRTVFVLKEMEGYSHAEIAGLLGISRGASEVRLCRAVRALRGLLGGEP